MSVSQGMCSNSGDAITLNPDVIAHIAAALCPTPTRDQNHLENPRKYVDFAILMCIHSQLRCQEFSGMSAEEICAQLNDFDLAFVLQDRKEQEQSLRLYPDDATPDEEAKRLYFKDGRDPVRAYLYAPPTGSPHLECKRTNHLLSQIRVMFLDRAHRRNQEYHSEIQSGSMCAWDGDAEYKRHLENSEVRETNANSVLRHNHSFGEEPLEKGRMLYWNFQKAFLDEFREWRLEVKERPGGIRGVEEKLGLRKPQFSNERTPVE